MGVPDNVENKKHEEKVIEILQNIEVNVSTKDIEACHQVGKSKNNSKKTIIYFINQKYAKKALLNRKGLTSIDSSSIGLTNLNYIFINENLTPTNSKLAFHCRKLKRDGHIEKTYTRNGIGCVQHCRVYKILHITTLFNVS